MAHRLSRIEGLTAAASRVLGASKHASALAIAPAVIFGALGCGEVDSDVTHHKARVAWPTDHKVWLSHDGYRDPDDNLALLIELGYATDRGADVSAFVFGDTTDEGQFRILHPTGAMPTKFDDEQNGRYWELAKNKQAAGNHQFFLDYARPAIMELDDRSFDMMAADNGGERLWRFDATQLSQISPAARALAEDIEGALDGSDRMVVYSAGGGANVAAEALGYLYGQGYEPWELMPHFAIVQHGVNNWVRQYEPQARTLTRGYTIAITNQDPPFLQNGWKGANLEHAISKPAAIDGSDFGPSFAKALRVCIGRDPYGAGMLKSGTIFETSLDGSDAGSGVFAMRRALVLAHRVHRMRDGEYLSDADHGILKNGSVVRTRVHFNDLDPSTVAALFD